MALLEASTEEIKETLKHYENELERYRAELNGPQATPEYLETIHRLMDITQGLIDSLKHSLASRK